MAEIATLARPYAEAVFRLAAGSGRLTAWSDALARMAQVAAHPDVQACISDPNLGADRLYSLFASLSGDLDAEAQNLLRVLIANDRLLLLPEIHALFEALKNEREGVVDAQIATAFEFQAGQLASLVAELEKRFGRRINPQVTVDKTLIGGVRVVVGDEVIDGSVRGKLTAMQTGLLSS
jgi:F-type H+-transporting ATPase subunit delta